MKKILTIVAIVVMNFFALVLALVWLVILTMSTDGGEQIYAMYGLYGLLLPGLILGIISIFLAVHACFKTMIGYALLAGFIPSLLLISGFIGISTVYWMFPVISFVFFIVWFVLYYKVRSSE